MSNLSVVVNEDFPEFSILNLAITEIILIHFDNVLISKIFTHERFFIIKSLKISYYKKLISLKKINSV